MKFFFLLVNIQFGWILLVSLIIFILYQIYSPEILPNTYFQRRSEEFFGYLEQKKKKKKKKKKNKLNHEHIPEVDELVYIDNDDDD